MAINCVDPNKIGIQATDLHTCITGQEGGKGLLDSFESSITNLKLHWIGSDAKTNITDLINVYNGLKGMLTSVQTYIVSVTNEQIIPLQQNIVNDGGICTIASPLAIVALGTDLTPPADTLEHRVEETMLADATEFEGIPGKFTTFVTNINEYKTTLLNNWLEGAGRENVVTSFNTFNEDVENYKAILDRVKNNISTVAANKKGLM